jgi:hypothetical protein
MSAGRQAPRLEPFERLVDFWSWNFAVPRNLGRLRPSKTQERDVSSGLVLGQAEGLQVMMRLHRGMLQRQARALMVIDLEAAKLFGLS